MPTLKSGAQFFIKEAIAQSDGSLILNCVCEDPGESMPALYPITFSPSETKGLPAIDAKPGALARLIGSKTFTDAVLTLATTKLNALAVTLRPPVDIAQAITDSIHQFTPVVELVSPVDAVEFKPLIMGENGLPDQEEITAKDAVLGVYEGGSYSGNPIVVP